MCKYQKIKGSKAMALSKWLPGLVVSFLLVAVSFAAPTAALQVVSWIVLGREHTLGKLEVAVMTPPD